MADLARTYGTKVYQLALRYTRNKEDAEEVAQDVLLKVRDKIDAFRGDAALSSWIYRITFNTAMSRLRTTRASAHGTRCPTSRLAPRDEAVTARDRAGRLVESWATSCVLRGQMREALLAAVAGTAGDLPGAGDPARPPGADDRRSEPATARSRTRR